MYKKDYVFNNVTFTVQSDNLDDFNSQLSHISQFYIPAIEMKNTCDNKINIKYNVEPKLYTELIEKTKNQKARLYQSFENQVHSEYSEDGNINVYIIDNEEYVCIKYDDDNYEVITDGKNKSKRWVFRIIREILVRKNEEKKGLFMHGTALVLDGKGILILGNSGSGKTTLATKLLSSNECEKAFLSNDRVFLYNNSGKLSMEYFPIPIVLAMGTVKDNKQLNEHFINSRIYEKRTGDSYEEATTNKKLDIPLTDIPKIFDGVDLKPIHKIDLIIFSKLNFEFREQIYYGLLSDLSQEVKLHQTCFTPFDSESLRMEWIYKRKTSHDKVIEDKMMALKQLSKKIPIIDLEYGIPSKGDDIIKLIKRNKSFD